MYIKFSTVKKKKKNKKTNTKNYLGTKWAKCATAEAQEEKAINSFEGLEVIFSACLRYG